MSLYNPLEHPDILPVILSFCEDRTLARLMRCSRSLLAAIVTARYPHVQVDPGASTLQQPNTIRTDLPTDARWFSPAFTAYIARFARVVSVRPHARWRCPPKGLMLGLGDEEGISGTARHSGHGEAECMALPGHESGDGGLPESVHVNALRVDMQGVCRPSTSVSHFHSDLPKSLDQSPCATLSFFRPDTMIITAFLYQNHLQAASSLSISRHTRRLVIELDITKNYETTHQRGVAVSLIPDCVLLAGMIPEGVEEVVVFVLPNAVFMKRNEGIRYAVFGSALAEFVVGSSEELTGQVGQNQGDEDDPDDIVVDEAGSDHADKGRRLGRTYTFVNLGQLNPSWAHKKVWDEYHLQTIVLSDILHNVASATSGAPPSPDTLSGITCHQYLSSRAGRSETPHNLLLERWHAASRQSHAIMAANRKAAEREKEREKAAAGMKGSMGGQVGVEGEEGNHGIGEMGGAVGVGVGGGGGAHGTTGGW